MEDLEKLLDIINDSVSKCDSALELAYWRTIKDNINGIKTIREIKTIRRPI